ncbi:hypothetical protein RRG08_008028 [Elysia crispata]|uniref:Uncharacterized protein n=1 Tax=Elysia crispata TaxID=231223 RepID=A0AAE1AH64_9GAST|nr:hypothetical protein RRG08_008028 [Elysia crispata]
MDVRNDQSQGKIIIDVSKSEAKFVLAAIRANFSSFGIARKPIWTHVRSSHRLMYRNNRKRQRVWTRKESSRDSSDFIRSNALKSIGRLAARGISSDEYRLTTSVQP